MRLRSGILSGATAAILGVSAAAAADTFVYDVVGGWTVHTDPSHAFSCFMEAQYEGGSMIRVGQDETGARMHMLVADPAWGNLEAGREYAVEVSFGADPAWNAGGIGYAIGGESPRTGLRFEIEAARRSAFVDQLMRRYSIEVGYDGREALSLSLAGSYQAALKLAECQEAMADVDDGSSPSRAEPRGDALSVSR